MAEQDETTITDFKPYTVSQWMQEQQELYNLMYKFVFANQESFTKFAAENGVEVEFNIGGEIKTTK